VRCTTCFLCHVLTPFYLSRMSVNGLASV
jgi:hypothetical protein